MLGKREENGCLGKQLLNVGSRAVMKMSHLHSHQASSSGENLSPRSVLEQCAVSGLAVALDLHNNNYSPTQENVVICRFLSKERLHHILLMNSKDLRTTSDGSFMMGRHLSKQMLDYVPADEEEVVPPNADVGLRMVDSLHIYGEDEDGDHASEYVSPHRPPCVKRSSSNSPSMHIMMNYANSCRSFPPRKGSWFHQGDDSKVSASSFVEGSIFSYPSYTSCNMSDDGDDDDLVAAPPIRGDFLKLCSFCKCQLNMGKDIYMYRGDQAFCSAECRYQQIVKDEGKGSSSSS